MRIELLKLNVLKFSGHIAECLTFSYAFEMAIHKNDALDLVNYNLTIYDAFRHTTGEELLENFKGQFGSCLKQIDFLRHSNTSMVKHTASKCRQNFSAHFLRRRQ